MNYKKKTFGGILLSLIVVLSLLIVSFGLVSAEVKYVKIYDKNGDTYYFKYDDDKESDKVLMVILELESDEYGSQRLVSIPDDEKEIVLQFYNTIKQDLLEEGE